MDLTWEELAGRALARQFSAVPSNRDVAAVVETIGRIGPLQAQTARSPYVALAARLPGIARETITAAYEQHAIVRGSNIRGTIHTSIPADNVLLDALTRLGQRTLWTRTMRLSETSLEELWTSIEHAAADWRTAAELADHITTWIATHDPEATPRLGNTMGNSMAYGGGGLIRRPAKGTAWEGQGAPVYRTAAAVLGDAAARAEQHAHPENTIEAASRLHLRAHGPSSRKDIAWWSGLGLRPIDAGLERLAGELITAEGPDGLAYFDLPDAPEPIELTGVRLLPEFDALLCGYDPPARERFIDAAHYPRIWNQDNGMILAPLMVDGRITGWWRLGGQGPRRPLEAHWFARTRRPRKAELAEPVAHLETAYGVTVTDLTLTRE